MGTNQVEIQKCLCPSDSKWQDLRVEDWKCPKISLGAKVMGLWKKVVHGSWFMVYGFVHDFVQGLVYGLVHSLVYGTWFMVSLKMFFLSPPWLWTPLQHSVVLEDLIWTRPFQTVLDNVLLDHGWQPSVLPWAVHPDFGHPPVTLEFLGLLSEPFNTTQTF